MRHDGEDDARRHRLAQQVLDEAARRGLRVWQQYQGAHVARLRNGNILPAPREWQRLVAAMSYEIACLLDPDCGWGCTVERAPGGGCLLYRPAHWNPRDADDRSVRGMAVA
jgi:hypothetical protein